MLTTVTQRANELVMLMLERTFKATTGMKDLGFLFRYFKTKDDIAKIYLEFF